VICNQGGGDTEVMRYCSCLKTASYPDEQHQCDCELCARKLSPRSAPY
jgi:hypothetical protein